MTIRHGKNTSVLIGSLDASIYLNNADFPISISTAETTTFRNGGAKTYIPGHADATASFSGFYDGAVGTISPVLYAMADAQDGTSYPVTYCPDGGATTVGNNAELAAVLLTGISTSSPVASATTIKVDGQATGGAASGKVLNGDTTLTSATITGTTVDDGASSANGGVAHIHVPLNSRTAAVDVKVQHSTNGTTWVDLAQQTVPAGVAVSGTTPFGQPTAYRLTVAGTINRYVRALITPTAGSGSYIAVVALARF
jgi:hypothetical protein